MSLDLNPKQFESAITTFLEGVGEDPTRPGIVKTPERLFRMCGELLYGYSEAAEVELEKIYQSKFPTDNDQLIIVRGIEVFSLCEHHFMPFYGECVIGYLPDKTVLGLSKFSRVVRIFCRRFQIQENLTDSIATSIEKNLACRGLMVSMKCTHLCCVGRGVRDVNVSMVTSSIRGAFKDNPNLKSEFLGLIK